MFAWTGGHWPVSIKIVDMKSPIVRFGQWYLKKWNSAFLVIEKI